VEVVVVQTIRQIWRWEEILVEKKAVIWKCRIQSIIIINTILNYIIGLVPGVFLSEIQKGILELELEATMAG
jgi:hypothetical protein